jgi:hypothetical protein
MRRADGCGTGRGGAIAAILPVERAFQAKGWSKLLMHQGVIISAVGHVAAVLLAVLFTGANPFDSVATEAIAVDIVSPSEVPSDQPPTDTPENPPQPPKESAKDFNFDLALPSQASTQPSAPSPKTGPAQQATQPRAREQRSANQPASPSAAPQATAKPQPAAPEAAAKPAPPPGPPVAMPPPAQETVTEADKAAEPGTDPAINVADLFGMPLTLPDGRLGGGFDAPAIETAKIEPSAVDAFRAHLKTCAALPTGVAPSEKISLVVRVTLKADGTLSAPPTLIEASASPKGPLLLQNLLRGLTKCQPYNMLPADKYREWKNLDMRFTPADMGQG